VPLTEPFVADPAGGVLPVGASAAPRRSRPASGRRLYRWLVRGGLRLLLVLYAVALRLATWVGHQRRPADGERPLTPPVDSERYDILLTGTFYSDGWLAAHVRPLAMSTRCARVRFVSASPVPSIDKVEAIYPPAWLSRAVGAIPARLITFVWIGLRARPHFVGGFHLLFNGLTAALLGRLTGARSMYFCVGGPAEVLGGGIGSENRVFEKLGTPDAVIERQLVRAVDAFDVVITMGHGAVEFFRSHGVQTACHVVSGGIDANRFRVADTTAATTDLILVGRLAPIKRVDLFLHVVERMRTVLPAVTATVVGDGPRRRELEELAHRLGLDRNVTFAGHQQDVEPWLGRARLFVLTSASEGLSLSLMEAMMRGLPAVVSHVGDLGELVEDGVNGFLVSEPTPDAFAARMVELLTNSERRQRFASAARHSAERHELAGVARRWDDILATVHGAPRHSGARHRLTASLPAALPPEGEGIGRCAE
jgi:L-malate glycosyltransferase